MSDAKIRKFINLNDSTLGKYNHYPAPCVYHLERQRFLITHFGWFSIQQKI